MFAGEYFRRYRTSEYLKQHHITVLAIAYPEFPAIIVSTHPTVDETRVYREIDPKAFHLMHAHATSRTRIRKLDEQMALYVSGTIPVYTDNHGLRSRTYQMVHDQLQKGRSVILNPTARTAGTIELPEPAEIRVGGLIRMLQETGYQYPVVPAYIDIAQNNITDTAKIADGALVRVKFGEVLPFEVTASGEIFSDISYIQTLIWDGWKKLQEQGFSESMGD